MSVPAKWRPPLALLVAGVVGLVFVLPLLAMAAVVAVSRSPAEVLNSVYANWEKIAFALSLVMLACGLTGFIFWRGLTRPLHALSDRADAVAQGGQSFDSTGPYGTREVARLASSFAVVVERLQERSRYLETLSAHLAHELKSPLTSIRGAAELLKSDGATMSPDQSSRFLENIIADADHLATFSSQLRDLARADVASGQGESTIGAVVELVRGAFPTLDIRLEAEPSMRLPLATDSARIVLHHLADNALHHGAGVVTLRSRSDGSLLVLNDGDPIRVEVRDKLFSPFFTTRRHDGGTGLGLAIVSALLASAHGRIELESPDPVTFRISFSG